MENKEYIVLLNVSFTTPVDVIAKLESEAKVKGIAEFKKKFKEIKKLLNDCIDENIEIDYVECDE
jgi:hypothetical protein